ncbi:substrate-binding periplasmic protein [Pseudoalteromonas viridis]|uniref:Transporter substrate-binding domain-containing protein n=1 Tax=Pseudoalteromonas viridis TaxID=339617 RepID=A0ABX7VBA2_9GAMM|nr:transporter substrate-binding domain-containing protein [Pseudoalteromonas viridis]QTL38186.1 transporter substrate-binding domain-containing protein [Pseudoalteromonas viridis]
MNRILAIALLVLSMSTWSQTLTIRADDWFPMNGNPNDPQPGYMIELAKAIFEAEGIEVDYQLMPWERALHEARSGNIDCVVGAYKEDAPDFVFPQAHWGLDRAHFYVAKGDSWRFSDFNGLLSRKVGLIGGYAYGDEFDAFAANNKGAAFQYMSGDGALDKNIKKLLAGRIDTIVESVAVLEAKVKEMGVQGQVVSAGELTKATPMYIACSPENPLSVGYMKMVDAAMPVLKSNGTLDKILDSYGLQPW